MFGSHLQSGNVWLFFRYVFPLELIYYRPHSFSQLNPKRIIQILHLPIRIIRFVTDPEVDLIIYIIQRLYQEFFVKHLGSIVVYPLSLVEKILGEDTLAAYLNFVARTASFLPFSTTSLTDGSIQYARTLNLLSDSSVPLDETIAEKTIFDQISSYLGPMEACFALLGKEVRLWFVKFKDAWYRMAVSNGPAERVFAIGLGYTIVALVLALYLNILTVGNARTATRAVRNAVRQQLLVLKVCVLMNWRYCSQLRDRLRHSLSLSLSCFLWDVVLFWTFVRSGFFLKRTFSLALHSLFNRHSRPCSIIGSLEPCSCTFDSWIEIIVDLLILVLGIPLLFFCPGVELCCVPEQCGSSEIPRIRTHIPYAISLIGQL